MSRFVRASKFRHIFGTAAKRELCYDNVKVSRSAHDSNIIKVNPLFMAINWESGGGGAFAVVPLDQVGKLPINQPLFNGHTGAVLDTDFNPFNDYVIVSASEDCTIKIWNIPEGGLLEHCATPAGTLTGHGKKVGQVLFHPTAENILASASFDLTVKIWDIEKGTEVIQLEGHLDFVQCMSWNWEGNLLATTSKDKKLRVWDVRAKKCVSEAEPHQGVKGSRVTWLGDSDRLVTTGFSRTSDRQIAIYDSKNMEVPLKAENLDTSSGLLMPFYDNDTKILYVAGKGDGNIRAFEMVEEDPFMYSVSEYKSSEPQRGLAFMAKRGVNVNEVEISRGYKLTTGGVEPISFKVPRKADNFQADLFPDTCSGEAVMSADEWLGGKTAKPKLVSLENGFVPPTAKKEFKSDAPANVDSGMAVPTSEKEYQDAYHKLRKENDKMKNEISQKDVKIRQLEVQLENMKAGK